MEYALVKSKIHELARDLAIKMHVYVIGPIWDQLCKCCENSIICQLLIFFFIFIWITLEVENEIH